MMEQVEFSNVVVMNKCDLVSEEQQQDIMEKIKLIQPQARVIKSTQSRVDVMKIMDTGLYHQIDRTQEFWRLAAKTAADELLESEMLECCEQSLVSDGEKCCKSKKRDGSTVDTGLSQVNIIVHLI